MNRSRASHTQSAKRTCVRGTVAFGLSLAMLACGCQKTLPATISGGITVDGQPLPTGNIAGEVMFYPVGGGAAAYASIDSSGKYNVSTGGTKGLEPGDYKVTVRVVEVEPEPPGGYKNAPGQRVLSAAKYQDRDRSDLTAKIEPGSNEINLDVTSK